MKVEPTPTQVKNVAVTLAAGRPAWSERRACGVMVSLPLDMLAR